MKKIIFLFLMSILTSCFNSSEKAKSSESVADCDKDKAKKTIEEIKTNEFSLLNKTDAGCGAATPTVALPTAIP